jgi:hypothetical protein
LAHLLSLEAWSLIQDPVLVRPGQALLVNEKRRCHEY